MARVFSGSNYLTGTLPSAINTLPKTFCAWYIDTDGTNNDRNIVDLGHASTTFYLERMARDAASQLLTARNKYVVGGAPKQGNSASTYTTNVWNHGLIEIAGLSSRTATLNGVDGTTDTATTISPLGMEEFTIGMELAALADGWIGRICEVAIWLGLLDTTKKQALAAGFSPLFFPENLYFYDRMIGGATASGGNSRDEVGGLIMLDNGSVGVGDHVPGMIYPTYARAVTPPAAVAGGGDLLLTNRSIANFQGIRQ